MNAQSETVHNPDGLPLEPAALDVHQLKTVGGGWGQIDPDGLTSPTAPSGS